VFAADLKVIMNSDISKIADNVEISVPDSTDDRDETRISFSSVTHQQVNQVNHHVNHIHVHVPSVPQSSDETPESACARNKIDPFVSSSPHQIKLHNSQFTQNRKLIFDSKVVPIKPDDRGALVRHRTSTAKVVRSNVLAMKSTSESGKQFSVMTTDSAFRTMSESLPMQSTEISASTNVIELEQHLPRIGNVIKWNPIIRAENVDL
jgi:hypothetical protein